MGTLKRVLQYLALVIFGLTLGFVFLEVVLRIADVGMPAELGQDFDRNSAFYLPQGGRLHPQADGADEVLRIAAIGDSFTVGEGNAWDDSYTFRLERLLNLNQGVTPAVVDVFASKGSATAGQVGYLRRAIASGAELIVLGITLNDPEQPGDPELRVWREKMMPRVPTGIKRRVLRGSRTLGLVYQRLEVLRARRAQQGYVHYLYDRDYAGWQGFVDALRHFEQACAQRGIPFVAVVFPTMSGLGPDYGMRFAHEQIDAALDEIGIPYLDLLPFFVDKSDARMSAYAEIDAHPSEIAHRIAADAIFEYLLKAGFVDDAYRPRQVLVERSREKWLELTRRMRSVLYP